MIDVSIKKIADRVYEIYGVVGETFVKRQYIGYTEEQAKEKFTETLNEGEI